MKDIANRADIELMVDTFYLQVKNDPTIGYIFTEVAKVSWEEHLPKMYSFWETILFNTASFKGNPMETHIQLSKKTTLNTNHFNQWVSLWQNTIDTLFEGDIAAIAKQRGKNIAGVMLYKIDIN